ncbi:MAG: hypothetical protein KDB27_07440 [Planctomycetales bacterium]|nr:hypothetical protein [Planctomycetales bacterium]
MRQFEVLAVIIIAISSVSADDRNASAVFAERIMPIFNSPDPSSCVQCHLSSVDLKDYIRPSSRDTFLSLRDQELIDVKRPRESKILHLIAMGESDPDSLAKRIHEQNRKAEYEAFATWIESCCKDTDLVNAPTQNDAASVGPAKPLEVVRHARKDRVLDSFVRNIWSQRMRCFPCHTPGELDPDNPMHAKPIERHKEFVAQHGAKMNIFKETPEKTLRSLAASSRTHRKDRLPLINLENPLQSLLILKPTSKLPAKGDDGKIGKPSSQIPVSHMGGIKMHKDDHSYKAFAAWLQDYAKSTSGEYKNGESLPKDNWYPTQHVVRIKGLTDWPNLATVQIFVHRWDTETESWSKEPVAFTQSKVTPRKIVNGVLFVLAQDDSRKELESTGETLLPGKVQLRLHLDHEDALSSDPTLFLNANPPDATAIIEAEFNQGFKNADIVEADQVVHHE